MRWDLLNKNLEKAISTTNASQKARMDLQTSLMLSKIKNLQEQQTKTTEMGQKFQFDLAMEKEKAKLDPRTAIRQRFLEEYNRQQAGQGGMGGGMPTEAASTYTHGQTGMTEGTYGQGAPGNLDITSEGEIKKLGLKDMAEKIYMKPETEWSIGEKRIVAQYRAFGAEKSPSWAQGQKVEAVRSGLKRGKIVLGKEFGEPSTYEPKTIDEATNAIQEAGLDPSMFTEELKDYEWVSMLNPKGKLQEIPRRYLEQALKEGWKEPTK